MRPPLPALLPTYPPYPFPIVKGAGDRVFDAEGHAYIDFYGGHCVCSTGHSHPKVAAAIADGLVTAAHAPGRGGFARSLFLLARAAGLGLSVDLSRAPTTGKPGWEGLLFSESAGRFLLVVRPDRAAELEARLAGLPVARIGAYDGGGRLTIGLGDRTLVDEPVEALARAWKREGERS